MLRFLTIERPITQTCRPAASEASMTSCRRWMCEANEVTITRPGASRMMRRSAAATTCSDSVSPAARRSSSRPAARRRRPRRAARSGARSVRWPSIGVWSSLKSPVCTIVPWSVCSATATASGIECVTRANSTSNGPHAARRRPGRSRRTRRRRHQAVLVELRLDQAERQPRAPDLAARRCRASRRAGRRRGPRGRA